MPKPLPTEMRSDLFKLEQGALLELCEIDLRHISSNADPDVKGEIYRFHNGVSQTKENIWQPPSGGCVLKHQPNCLTHLDAKQPPSCGCVLKPEISECRNGV